MVNKKINKALEKEVIAILLKEFKNISSESDLYNFFDRFMTGIEKDKFFKRIAVIALLNKNNKYRDIKKEYCISGNTISRARDVLEGRGYGRNPNRKRKYSNFSGSKKPVKRRRSRYKGTSGFLDPFF
ncbi:MAG: trp operon repressor [Patescibacteria group bacterium]|nr:trp operon repressor [Patescibacteria group bacterium]